MADRALSTVVSYVLTLGIVVLLLSSLIGVFGPLVTNQQDDAVRSNLVVFGNDLAGDLESADRLAGAAGDDGIVELRTRLPDRVGGNQYEIAVEPAGGGYEIQFRSQDLDAPVVVTVETNAAIDTQPESLDGGTLVISYESDTLVIRNA